MSTINFLKRFVSYVNAPGQRTERTLNWQWMMPLIAILCPGLIFLKIADVLPRNSAAAEERNATPVQALPQSSQASQSVQPSETPQTITQGTRPQEEQASQKPMAHNYLIKEADGRITVLDKKEAEDESNFNPMNLTKAELKVLETLSSRRKELDEQERKSDLRMALLQASEQRIDQKLERLEHLRTSIEKLLKKHETHEQNNFKSLAKIYEKMKPKEAARIFSQLDMPVLLHVISHINETKASQIMSFMDTDTVRELTLFLAHERPSKKETEANDQAK